jgi:hypothetical protein
MFASWKVKKRPALIVSKEQVMKVSLGLLFYFSVSEPLAYLCSTLESKV